jgi:hypothetical protein
MCAKKFKVGNMVQRNTHYVCIRTTPSILFLELYKSHNMNTAYARLQILERKITPAGIYFFSIWFLLIFSPLSGPAERLYC